MPSLLRQLKTDSPDFSAQLDALLDRDQVFDTHVEKTVREIIGKVRQYGDQALLDLTAQYDGLRCKEPADLEIDPSECENALSRIDVGLRRSLEHAADRIRQFHTRQRETSWHYEQEDGTRLGQQIRPLERVGICLGLQALFDHSTEDGGRVGLGFLKGEVKHFTEGIGLDHDVEKVPHMGWNNVTQTTSHPLWAGINQYSRFYFVHSYYADAVQCVEVLGTTEYGVRFTSAAGRENVFAVQFHPEKSHTQGLALLHNFVHWNGCT